MDRIKERISTLVNNQVPEFIRYDYPLFITFLEAYYKFLEQDQGSFELIQNSLSYRDIDSTVDSFVEYFVKNYGNNIARISQTDKRLLLKKISDLYAAKGSSLSFKTLFRVLFNTSVDVRYPYENVLRASDGLWDQNVAIKVRLQSGSAENINEKILYLSKNGATYTAGIYRVRFITSDLFEVFIKADILPPYEIGDTVFVDGPAGTIFTGIIEPVPVSYTLISGGSGFKAGQIFSLNIANNVDTVIQISRVSDLGAIQRLKFLNYGYNFPSTSFTFDLTNQLNLQIRPFSISTKIAGVGDSFEMLQVYLGTEPGRYFNSDYVEIGYNGILLAQSSDIPNTSGDTVVSFASADPSIATIILSPGSIGRYPGQYLNNKSFLSEPDIRLQDGKRYQPYAYELETDVDLSLFYNIVKQLIHPAGTNLFNNLNITTAFDVSSSIDVIARSNVFFEFYSTVGVSDTISITKTP